MKIHDMLQRTPEWDDVRKGKITASVAAKMITPTGKPSTQAKPFIGTLLAEEMGLQEPEQVPQTEWVERGIDLESEALGWFQVETGQKVMQCGFIESDDGLSGFSPDGFIKEKIGGIDSIVPLELKVPKPSTHIGYLIEGCLPKLYLAQCHFAMVVAGAPYMYFMSYNPGLAPVLIKVQRDDFTDKVGVALNLFKKDLVEARKLVAA